MVANSIPQVSFQATHVMIVRSMIIALNHANLTDDYSVLRKLGTSEFARVNREEKLSNSFREFRLKKIDLVKCSVLTPVFITSPLVDRNRILTLNGYFLDDNVKLNFSILVKVLERQFKLSAFSVSFDSQSNP